MEKVHFTDGEGPIVYKDLAADLTAGLTFHASSGREVSGHDFYAVLSYYDDYLAEMGTEGYQAGDTLALVGPLFLAHGLTNQDIEEEARSAKVCYGVEEFIAGLHADKWKLRIISTAYSPMWQLVGDYLKIPMEQIACTNLDLAALQETHGNNTFLSIVREAESEIAGMVGLAQHIDARVKEDVPVEKVFTEDEEMVPLTNALDRFYFKVLPEMGYRTLQEVRVMGGRKKVEAAHAFAQELDVPMSHVSYAGDSITDDQMHRYLKGQRGLPIGLNGNKYALRNARVGIATTDMRSIRPVLNAWVDGGIDEVYNFVVNSDPQKEDGVRYDMVYTKDPAVFNDLVAIHGKFRTAVRGKAAAKLS